MKHNRFVSPETVKINLSEGDWIEIKKELNVGEDRKYRAAGLKRLSGTPGSNATAIDVDWEELALARVLSYLVDWSFVDANGKSVEMTPAAVRNLEQADFEEIDNAIQAHMKEMVEAKKPKTGAQEPPSA